MIIGLWRGIQDCALGLFVLIHHNAASLQGGISGLHHHLFSQLFRDAARLRLPAQCRLIRVVLLRVDCLQPLPERLIHRKVELCTGVLRYLLLILEPFHYIVVQSPGKLQFHAQCANVFGSFFTALYFPVYTHRPFPAKIV